MLKQPKGNHIKAWGYTATALYATKQWELASKVGSGTPDCQHGMLPGLPNPCVSAQPLQCTDCFEKTFGCVIKRQHRAARMRHACQTMTPRAQNIHKTCTNCPISARPCSGLWRNLFPGACLQACHLAIRIDKEDPTAVKITGAIERMKIKAGLGVSQCATTKEIHRKLLQTQPAVVRSKQTATATSPEAVCTWGGSSCATQPEAQPLEGLQQAVEEPISAPETSKTQKVRRPAALMLQTSTAVLHILHVAISETACSRVSGCSAANKWFCAVS